MVYGGGGLLVTGLYTIDPALFPRGVFYLGCIAIVIGALSLFGGLRLVCSTAILEWTTHARLIAGFAIYVTAVIILGDKVVAFALVPLLTVPTSCYLYTWRPALPYVVAGASIVCLGAASGRGTRAGCARAYLDVRVPRDRGGDDRHQAANTTARLATTVGSPTPTR